MRNILTVNDLSVRYPDSEALVLSQISFSVKQGESLLLMGASGCGKSTLAYAIAGLIPRAVEAEMSGTIVINGTDISTLAPGEACQQVALVFQDPEAQFCMLNVEDEIAFGLENIGLPADEMDERIARALEDTGLTSQRHTLIHRLSGGMKQRLAIACALALRPSMIILDEPTANLDPAATDDFFTLLGQLIETRAHTLILVEHKLEKPAALIDRVMVIDHSEIVAEGSPREIFETQRKLLDNMGVWQPYASEIAGKLSEEGYHLSPHPLILDELVSSAKKDPAVLEAVVQLVIRERKSGRPDDSFDTARTDEAADAGGTNFTGCAEDAGGDGQTAGKAIRPDAAGMSDTDRCEEKCDDDKHTAISFRNVSFSYKTPFSSVSVIRDLNWQVPKGRFVALLGENGAGKSTLARLALGLLKPSKGDISLFGKSVKNLSGDAYSQKVGLVFQNPEHQFITDTVWEEIAYSLKVSKVPGSMIPKRVKDLLTEFSLADKAHMNPFTLSQGEKRRLSVASMLTTSQQLLILDEPSFGQDFHNTYQLMNLVKARQLEGCTVIMITHDMRLVWEYATDVALLNRSSLTYSGDVLDLFRQKNLLDESSLKQPLAWQLLQRLSAESHLRAHIGQPVRKSVSACQSAQKAGDNHV